MVVISLLKLVTMLTR